MHDRFEGCKGCLVACVGPKDCRGKRGAIDSTGVVEKPTAKVVGNCFADRLRFQRVVSQPIGIDHGGAVIGQP